MPTWPCLGYPTLVIRSDNQGLWVFQWSRVKRVTRSIFDDHGRHALGHGWHLRIPMTWHLAWCVSSEQFFFGVRSWSKQTAMAMRYIDLFCGMGSFTYSFERLGYECVMACDVCPTARANFEHNFGIKPQGNIEEIDEERVPDHDVLCAGWPCQSFSRAGLHRGFRDERGSLFSHVMRIIDAKAPMYVVLENVPTLLTHNDGRSFKTIDASLRRAGYAVEFDVLNCADYGLPQLRRRLIIVAFQTSISDRIDRPILCCSEYRRVVTLSDMFGRPFQRPFAFTIRCGGRCSGIDDRHNWDSYRVGSEVITLTLDDARRLQGFDEYVMGGSATQQWKLLGNTIPTIFTHMLGERLLKCHRSPVAREAP